MMNKVKNVKLDNASLMPSYDQHQYVSKCWVILLVTFLICITLIIISFVIIIFIKFNSIELINLLPSIAFYISIFGAGVGTPFVIKQCIYGVDKLIRRFEN